MVSMRHGPARSAKHFFCCSCESVYGGAAVTNCVACLYSEWDFGETSAESQSFFSRRRLDAAPCIVYSLYGRANRRNHLYVVEGTHRLSFGLDLVTVWNPHGVRT